MSSYLLTGSLAKRKRDGFSLTQNNLLKVINILYHICVCVCVTLILFVTVLLNRFVVDEVFVPNGFDDGWWYLCA